MGGCGKKGHLNPPPDTVSTYPASYPQYAEQEDVEEEIGILDDQGLEDGGILEYVQTEYD